MSEWDFSTKKYFRKYIRKCLSNLRGLWLTRWCRNGRCNRKKMPYPAKKTHPFETQRNTGKLQTTSFPLQYMCYSRSGWVVIINGFLVFYLCDYLSLFCGCSIPPPLSYLCYSMWRGFGILGCFVCIYNANKTTENAKPPNTYYNIDIEGGHRTPTKEISFL